MSAKQHALDAVATYVQQVASVAKNSIAREHSYRPALVQMFNIIAPDTEAFNDPARSSEGQPDFVYVQKSNAEIVRGYGEAKDLGALLDRVERSEQLIRYAGYDNLILTNELEFRFYREGEKYASVQVARLTEDGKVEGIPGNFSKFIDEFLAFIQRPPAKITSATKLAISMGGKARRVRNFVLDALDSPGMEGSDELLKIFSVVKRNLVADMGHDEFADMYAQTLIYGLFSARYSDKTPQTFTRQEARDLIPAASHFLRTFFDHVAGPGFAQGLARIVQEMCEVLAVSDVSSIVHQQLKADDDEAGRDPIIHFYEDFLREYDAIQRKKRGAYYTPTQVVRFIVRAVDSALINDFGVSKGLADSGKRQLTVPTQPSLVLKPGNVRRSRSDLMTVDIHKVQILDFATGTATFLNEVIKFIHKGFKGQEGLWPSYAEQDLIPRLNGFELMMAPYAIAHMKLGMTMSDLGVNSANRFRVFLTNTLEEPRGLNPDLFQFGLLEALTEESEAASEIKEQRPIMVVIGNPPYSGESANNFAYANSFADKYKVEPGGKEALRERNTKWLMNDYVKFIGFAEDLITKNGSGIVGVITDNSYLMSPTFRGMRWHLANTFDRLMVLDLHGRKIPGDKPDAMSSDQNVFDIMQGVSILIAVKDGTKPEGQLAEVMHAELIGSRASKFQALEADDITWEKLELDEKAVYFKPAGVRSPAGADGGVALNEIFNVQSVGIAAGRDAITIATTREELADRLADFSTLSVEDAKARYGITKQGVDWKVSSAQADIGPAISGSKIIPITYRPFDTRFTYYTGNSGGIHTRPRHDTSRHLIGQDNIALCFNRRIEQNRPFADAFVSKNVIQFHSLSIKESNYFAPLYVFDAGGSRHSNLRVDATSKLFRNLSVQPTTRQAFEYVYGVLNDPVYRDLNGPLLRLDYPVIPVADGDASFEAHRALGSRLIDLHTFAVPNLDVYETTFPVAGDNVVTRAKYEDGRVYFNDHQYFGNVDTSVWEYLVGSYNPALKWLKDRKGTQLSANDIRSYQRLLKVIAASIDAAESFTSPLVADQK